MYISEQALKLKEQFCESCAEGDLKSVKQIYEKLDLNRNLIDNFEYYEELLNSGINDAIENSQLKVVQYLFDTLSSSFNVPGIIDTNAILNTACLYDELNIAKFILEKNKEKDLCLDIDEAFQTVFTYDFREILKVLIFEYDMPKNDVVDKCLYMDASGISNEVKNMFKLRSLNKQLTQDLNPNTINANVQKLKI